MQRREVDRIRVVIAVGSAAAAETLVRELCGGGWCGHAGVVYHLPAALALVSAASPDVVLADVHLPEGGGLELTRWVRQQQPTTPVILLTEGRGEEELFDAMRYGAAAYVSLQTPGPELAQVVLRVAQGEYVIDDHVLANPAVASRVLKAFRELATVEDQQIVPLFAPLSPREIEVLENAARGNSNKQIARLMHISEQTVKNHLTSIMRKLAVNDRTQAVVYALRHGWIRV